MAKILVNPPSLLTIANTITTTIASSVQKAGDMAWRSASGAPSYDGQFGPKVRALGQAALSRAKKQSASTNLLSGSLSKRAKAFQAADSAAVKGVQAKTGLFNIYDPVYLRFLSIFLGLTIAQVLLLLRLGALGIPIGLLPWGKLPRWIIPPWWPFPPLFPPKKPDVPPVEPPLPPIVTTEPEPPKKWPEPPTQPVLKPASPKDTTCALYAAARRPDLGSTQSDRERFQDQAAANYICKFQEKAFQITADDVSSEKGGLTNIVGVGYAVVWEPGVMGYDKTYGHVAIIEEVYPDRVVISHAGRSITSPTKTLYIKDLTQLWLIP